MNKTFPRSCSPLFLYSSVFLILCCVHQHHRRTQLMSVFNIKQVNGWVAALWKIGIIQNYAAKKTKSQPSVSSSPTPHPLRHTHLSTAFSKRSVSTQFFFLFLNPHWGYVFIDFRERGRDKDRNNDVREKHGSVASLTCRGSNLQPWRVPWPGFEPTTFWRMGWCSDQLSHLARAVYSFSLYINGISHTCCSMTYFLT